MAYGDHIARTDEHVGLADLQTAIGATELCRPQDDEQGSVVLFEFRPLVRGERVLDGQIVKAEFLLDETEYIRVRFEQSDPDEAIALAEGGAHIGQGQVGNAVSVGVGRAVDDPRCRRVFVFEHGQ